MAQMPMTPKQVIRKVTENSPIQLAYEELEMLVMDNVEQWALYWMNGGLYLQGNKASPDIIISKILPMVEGCGVPISSQAVARKIARFLREQGGRFQSEGADAFRTPTFTSAMKVAEQNRLAHKRKLRFGIDELDNACGGVYGGDMIGIFGNPGSHKTMLMTNAITQWIIDGGQNVILFELDMGRPVMLDRLLAKQVGCSPKRLRGMEGTNEYKQAQKDMVRFYGDKLTIMDRCDNTGRRWTIDKVIEAIERFEPEVVAIDYLTCLEIEGQFKPNEHELAKIASQKLCDAAQRYGTLIITLSQMSQKSQAMQKAGSFGAMPMGGTDVWNDSDAMIELQSDTSRNDNGQLETNIIATVRKSRSDGVLGKSFKLERDNGRFKSTAEEVEHAKRGTNEPIFKPITKQWDSR